MNLKDFFSSFFFLRKFVTFLIINETLSNLLELIDIIFFWTSFLRTRWLKFEVAQSKLPRGGGGGLKATSSVINFMQMYL